MSDFVPIQNYEEYYRINSQGEVLSSYYGIILKHGIAEGYPRVVLYRPGRGGKSHSIHRLLALHFIPNPENLPEVNHKDGDRSNFSLENLEWVSSSTNRLHSYRELGRSNGWGATRPLVNRDKICEYCGGTFQYKKKAQRFCNNTCAARGSIELFKQGVLKS